MLARSALLACDFLSLFFTLLFICLIQLTQLLRDTLRHHHHFPFLKQFNYFLQGCFVPASQLFYDSIASLINIIFSYIFHDFF